MSDVNTVKSKRTASKTVKAPQGARINVDGPVNVPQDVDSSGPAVAKRGRGRPITITSLVSKRAAMAPKVDRARKVLAEFDALNERIAAMGDNALQDALVRERERLAELERLVKSDGV